jgi:hypothetical protein
MNELQRWANFYLLISAAAPTLIGLLFAVITFSAERMAVDGTAKIRMVLLQLFFISLPRYSLLRS